MTYGLKRSIMAVPLLAPLLLGGCVSQGAYNALEQQNQQLRTQLADAQAHVVRLQGAIEFTVNSDLLFSSGGSEISVSLR
jgi:chemotaxis protein MotB